MSTRPRYLPWFREPRAMADVYAIADQKTPVELACTEPEAPISWDNFMGLLRITWGPSECYVLSEDGQRWERVL